MTLKKPKAPVATEPSEPEAWADLDRKTQRIHLAVRDWQYQLSPSLYDRKEKFTFSFEGMCTSVPLKGAIVTGEVEILDPPEPPRMLTDQWRTVPDEVEGYCFLDGDRGSDFVSSIGLTLYCRPSSLDWIHRAFAIGAQSRSGVISIELLVDCPNNQGGDFWKDRWRHEWLRIAGWHLYSGANLRHVNPNVGTT
jgi:hypothetical protein